MEDKFRYHIFLSYSHKDEDDASFLANELRENGMRCFLAKQSIRVGEAWERSIRESLIASQRIVVLVTKNSLHSNWVGLETGAGWALEKDIIPALWKIRKSDLGDNPIKRYQCVEIDPAKIDKFVEKILPEEGAPGKLKSIFGSWTTPMDDDRAFFFQKGDRFVGFFNHGGEHDIVGIYLGIINYPETKEGTSDSASMAIQTPPELNFIWEWRNRALCGSGRAILEVDQNADWIISGDWWYSDEDDQGEYERKTIFFRYKWVSSAMPNWVTADDISEFIDFLNGSENESWLSEAKACLLG